MTETTESSIQSAPSFETDARLTSLAASVRTMRNEEDGFGRKALIFREDPETGEFEFLGTEQANTMW